MSGYKYAAGTIAANGASSSALDLEFAPEGSVVLEVTGTYVGLTLIAEGDALGDGNWKTLTLETLSGVSAASVTPTSTQVNEYIIPRRGMSKIRVTSSAWTSGTATVKFGVARSADYSASAAASEAASAASLAALDARAAITTTALVASKVLLAAPGTLYKAAAIVDDTLATGTYYLHLLNAGSLPADGAVTHLCTPIIFAHTLGLADDLSFNDDIPVGGLICSAGAVVVLSTALTTLTHVAAAHLLVAGA